MTPENIYIYIFQIKININGLSSHTVTSLNHFIHKRSIDILALQETMVNKDNLIPEDTFSGKLCFVNTGSRGVALVLSTTLQPQLIASLGGTSTSNNFASVWALCKINSKTTVLVSSVYCNPEQSSNGLKCLLKNIEQAQDYCKQNKLSNILVLGDFNARSKSWGDSTENERGKTLKEFVNNKVDCHLSSPGQSTFVAPNGSSVIDLCLSFGTLSRCLCDPWVEKQDIQTLFTGAPIRGHFPVMRHLVVTPDSQRTKVKKVFDYENANWKAWSSELHSLLSEKLMEEDESLDTFEMSKFFISSVIATSDKHIPLKSGCCHSKPFWSTNLSNLSKELRTAQDKFLAQSTPHNKVVFEKNKVLFKSAIIKEKNEWIHNQLEGLNVRQSQEFWKKYKRIFHKQDESFIGNLECPTTKLLLKTDKEKEDAMFTTFFCGKHLEKTAFDNEHYNNVKEDLHQLMEDNFGIPELHREKQRLEAGMNVDNPMVDLLDLNDEISKNEIRDAIRIQKTADKCKDGDSIHPLMLKHLPSVGIDYLCKLYNLILENGEWVWTDAIVTFIRKTGKPSYLSTGAYRPLSISSYIGKILERILDKRLRTFCKLNDVIDDAQEGFLPQKNTTRYLYKMLAKLNEAKRRKLTAFILLIDFEKAFDSVDIACLMKKLAAFGIKGKVLKLLYSFLSCRNVKLRINGFLGIIRKCLFGLPQGSVLSPLLFIIFISDLFSPSSLPTEVLGTADFFKFADDGSVSVIGSSTTQCYQYMQALCDYIHSWCTKWRLVVNCDPNKTEIIILKPKTKRTGQPIDDNIPKIKLGDKELMYVSKSKVLGVILDDELSFQHHAKAVLTRCWYAWHQLTLNTTRYNGLNTSTLLILFKTVVLTKLLYAAPVWLYLNFDVFKQFMARAILKILGAQGYPSKMLAEVMLGLPPLQLLAEQVTIKFIMKCLAQQDSTAAIILQVEATPQHVFYNQIWAVKRFIKWRMDNKDDHNSHQWPEMVGFSQRRSDSSQALQLVALKDTDFIYSKDEIQGNLCYKWDNLIKQDIKSITKTDPFSIEELHSEEYLCSIVDSQYAINNSIFQREDKRMDSTNIADFIHGHCFLFEDFTFSYLKADKTKHVALCLECFEYPDSVYHKVFECIYSL